MTGGAVRRGFGTVALAVAVAIGASACGTDEPTTSGSSTSSSTSAQAGAALPVADFAAAIEKPGTTLIDVRTPAEFAAGHLREAVNIDVQGTGFAAAVAGLDPGGTYAVYCHSGSRSAVAVAQLVGRGFANLYQLGGGITAWQAAGRPITTS